MKVNQMLTLLPQGQDVSKRGSIEKTLNETSTSFSQTLANAVADVNSLQSEAGKAVDRMVSGDAVDLHDVMVAVEKAKTSFELLMEIRNKTISAYQEIMRMQV
ncbi:MAG TPA: flagellar hook-basal body complex protein FliE [Bacteroidota bacterium]|nr:flagellar hook-basal body complex protein FliE [Bacteroidota bacterium]